jgi:hypothetical protein
MPSIYFPPAVTNLFVCEVGWHFAGPTWQLSDGSRVMGRPAANAAPDPSSGCGASHKGEEARSHYTAVYYFYTKR